MPTRMIYVAHAWPERADPEWARQFVEALRAHGLEVVEEWSIHDQASREAAERGLRESDLIVSLLGDGTGSPIFYFELGVALAGDKEFVAVVPPEVPPISSRCSSNREGTSRRGPRQRPPPRW